MELSHSKMQSINVFNSKPLRTKLFQSELQYTVDRKKKEQSEHSEQRISSINSDTKRKLALTCQENFNEVFRVQKSPAKVHCYF